VPSQLYSFSFAPNPDWSMSFSPQPEIQAYLRKTAQRSGTLDRFRFRTTLEAAEWDAATQRWNVRTSGGDYTASTLIVGAGGLSEPRLPDIEGIEEFQGELFHSARWNHDVDLTGKRVAVIGTGASAIQIVPEVQQTAAHLDVYQRTAPYVVPRNDRSYGRLEQLALRHVPGLQRLYRTAIYWSREGMVPGLTLDPKLAWPVKKMAMTNLVKGVADPELRSRLTPPFEIGCKRILISNSYYPAIAADNVELVTDPIAKVTGEAVVTADGVERPVDVIVVATGFYTTELPIAERITGRTGRTLSETWREHGMAAYKGTTVPEFPNLFFLVGPNTGLGHSSMVFMIEAQVDYVRDAIKTMNLHRYAAVEPRQDATREWNAALQSRMKRTVWNTGGCSSWYLDKQGRNTILWPRTTFAFRALLSSFDVAAYDVQAPTPTREDATV
jgi:cation diffusion facilitator CzcD-associated flavoprotein CzcO